MTNYSSEKHGSKTFIFNLGSSSWTMELRQVRTLEAAPPEPPLTTDGHELGGRCCHVGLKEIQISVGLWGANNYETYKFGAQTFRALVQLIHFFICWCRRHQPIICPRLRWRTITFAKHMFQMADGSFCAGVAWSQKCNMAAKTGTMIP